MTDTAEREHQVFQPIPPKPKRFRVTMRLKGGKGYVTIYTDTVGWTNGSESTLVFPEFGNIAEVERFWIKELHPA